MTRPPPVAKLVARDPDVLPDDVGAGVLCLQRLRRSGLIAQLEGWLPLSRHGGYTVTTIFAALTVFLLAGPGRGIRPFLRRVAAGVARRVAAVVGRRNLPSASSLSRALSGLGHAEVRAFLDKLLGAAVSGTGILDHPAVHHLDATGGAWHVIDVDPTVKATRRRDLPVGPEYFEGRGRSPGEPGFTGRKRGEARTRAVPVIHDGAGIWLGLRLLPTEGSVVPMLRELVDQALRALGELGVTPDRTIFRGDGEFGSVAALKSFVDRGAHALARISRYGLLDVESVGAIVDGATWSPVRPGESGIQREATDLGTIQLTGSEDGRPQVGMRVVASRMPCSSAEKAEGEKGIRRKGFVVELFATTLDPQRWPAPDVIELVGGRSSIENRFLQEDREFDLDRTFSQNPAGQELVRGIGLFLWNEQVCEGWRQKPPPIVSRRQQRRPPSPVSATAAMPEEVDTQPLAPPVAPFVTPPADAPVTAGPDSVPGDRDAPDTPPPSIEHGNADRVVDPSLTIEALGTSSSAPDARVAARATLGAILVRAFDDLTARDGWSIDGEAGLVRCPGGQALYPYNLALPRSGAPRLAVRSAPHACLGCPSRRVCFPEDRTGPFKQVSRALLPEEAAAARTALTEIRRGVLPPLRAPPRRTPAAAPRSPIAQADAESPPFHQPPRAPPPGPWFAERPIFLPAAARRRTILPKGKVVRIEVRYVAPPHPRRADPLLAEGRHDRAHRRMTRAQIATKDQHDSVTTTRVTVQPRKSA